MAINSWRNESLPLAFRPEIVDNLCVAFIGKSKMPLRFTGTLVRPGYKLIEPEDVEAQTKRARQAATSALIALAGVKRGKPFLAPSDSPKDA